MVLILIYIYNQNLSYIEHILMLNNVSNYFKNNELRNNFKKFKRNLTKINGIEKEIIVKILCKNNIFKNLFLNNKNYEIIDHNNIWTKEQQTKIIKDFKNNYKIDIDNKTFDFGIDIYLKNNNNEIILIQCKSKIINKNLKVIDKKNKLSILDKLDLGEKYINEFNKNMKVIKKILCYNDIDDNNISDELKNKYTFINFNEIWNDIKYFESKKYKYLDDNFNMYKYLLYAIFNIFNMNKINCCKLIYNPFFNWILDEFNNKYLIKK